VRTAESGARQSDCEKHVAALAGKDQASLKDPAVTAMAAGAPDLVTCLAVKQDSRAVCDSLVSTQEGKTQYSSAARDCIYMQSIFHEARAYPKGTSFTFSDIEMEQCEDRKSCEALREATRSGDEAKCDALRAFKSICRAFVKLDKSLCRVEGKLEGFKGANEADAASKIEEGCRTTIDSRSFLARGLQAVADSGSGKERTLARAALGQPDACKEHEQTALKACLAASSASPPAPPVPAEKAPPAPAEKAPPAPPKTPADGGQADTAAT
jgi:hypothetical protein